MTSSASRVPTASHCVPDAVPVSASRVPPYGGRTHTEPDHQTQSARPGTRSPVSPTTRRRFDDCVAELFDAAFRGRDDDARQMFASVQAFTTELNASRDDARAWVDAERRLVAQLPADIEDRTERAQIAVLGRLRKQGGHA